MKLIINANAIWSNIPVHQSYNLYIDLMQKLFKEDLVGRTSNMTLHTSGFTSPVPRMFVFTRHAHDTSCHSWRIRI